MDILSPDLVNTDTNKWIYCPLIWSKKLSEGLSRPRTAKKIEKIWERIGRLKERSHGAGQHYKVEITLDESGKIAQAIHWEKNPYEGSIVT